MNKVEIIIVSVITAVVLIVWIGSEVKLSSQSDQPDQNIQDLMEQIPPDLDKETLKKVDAVSLQAATPPPNASSTPAPAKASPSAKPSVKPSASASASATTKR